MQAKDHQSEQSRLASRKAQETVQYEKRYNMRGIIQSTVCKAERHKKRRQKMKVTTTHAIR